MLTGGSLQVVQSLSDLLVEDMRGPHGRTNNRGKYMLAGRIDATFTKVCDGTADLCAKLQLSVSRGSPRFFDVAIYNLTTKLWKNDPEIARAFANGPRNVFHGRSRQYSMVLFQRTARCDVHIPNLHLWPSDASDSVLSANGCFLSALAVYAFLPQMNSLREALGQWMVQTAANGWFKSHMLCFFLFCPAVLGHKNARLVAPKLVNAPFLGTA